MYQLEDRVLFDAALAADVADAEQAQETMEDAASAMAEAQDEAAAASAEHNPADAVTSSASGDADADDLLNPADPVDPGTPAEGVDKVRVLVVADDLWDADGLAQMAADGVITVKFDADASTAGDLLTMISEALDGREADSIGFLTKAGTDGALKIIAGDDTTLETLGETGQKFFWSGVRNLLSEDGRIDLFASDLAASETGRSLVDAIGDLTGHEVAASTDASGDQDAGGDWELEYSSVSGNADADTDGAAGKLALDAGSLYFDRDVLDDFNHKLDLPKEVVFINESVLDIDQIIAGLDANAEYCVLSNENAMSEVLDFLDGRTDIDSIHFITHGNDGEFYLGTQARVDADFVEANKEFFTALGDSLSEDGDIMIYGCNVAASEAGREMLGAIAELTDSDVAASTDRTGFYGNWTLEYEIGSIESMAYSFDGYAGSLATWTVSVMKDYALGGTIDTTHLTLREAISLSENGDTIVFKEQETTSLITIKIESTLRIGKNITIDGSIKISKADPVYNDRVVIDASNAHYVAFETGDTLINNVTLSPGNELRLDWNGKTLPTLDDLRGVTGNSGIDQNTILDNSVVLSGETKLENTMKVGAGALEGDATLADGTTFGSNIKIGAGNEGLSVGTGSSGAWTNAFDLNLGGNTTVKGTVYTNSAWDGMTEAEIIAQYPEAKIAYAVELQGDQTLASGSVIKAGTVFSEVVNYKDTAGNDVTINAGVATTADITLRADLTIKTGGTRLADGSTLAQGTTIQAGTTLRETFIAAGSFMQSSGAEAGGDVVLLKGMTLSGTTTAATGSTIGKGVSLTYDKATFDASTTKLYNGTVLYEAGETVASGTELLGDITISERAFYIDSQAAVSETVVSTESKTTEGEVEPYTGTVDSSWTYPHLLSETTKETIVSEEISPDGSKVTVSRTVVTQTFVSQSTAEGGSTGEGTTEATGEDSGTTTDTATYTKQSIVTTTDETVRYGSTGIVLENLVVRNGASQTGIIETAGAGLGGGLFISARSDVQMYGVEILNCSASLDGG
ncbi:MAG: DUF4347 domain-containing protein, partial [Victivallaceae bacterium]|nr:DUF4347 domain-containing protein [Victivallaceae bacterium]